MKTITVEDQQVNVYNIHDFPYNVIDYSSTVERSKYCYLKQFGTLDIETTSISVEECDIFERDFGFMYVWQACFAGFVCVGRTWKEYQDFIFELESRVKYAQIVFFVHNLPFEFQFFRNFFKVSEIFARKQRDVVRCEAGKIQYRCSYALSNMSLAKFLEKTKGVTFKKQSGEDFDYHKKRYPDTELTDAELGYCVCDVLGLWQAINTLLEDDDLISLPMTSTGYVRREYRERCLSTYGYKRQVENIALNKETYMVSREASRGAIAGSNHIHTDKLLTDVDSFDIKSSYPFQMETKYFPQSRFLKHNCLYGTEKFEKLINNFCCIIVWECRDLKLRHWESIPYISKAKCRAIEKARVGNGKVYSAKRIGMCCTEIDFQIIRNHYKFDESSVKIHNIYVAQRGMLAKPFREYLSFMFQQKTDLEDGDPFLYAKYKNRINASFGMMLTDILHPEITFDPYRVDSKGRPKVWKEEEIPDIDKALNEYYRNRNTFLSYQHGVWVLAHGRNDLITGMDIVGDDLVQVDTDSVKTLGDYKEDFDQLNQKIIDNAENFDVKPYSMKNGNKHYLGVWEHEGKEGKYTYEQFKTLGAKKYAVIKSGTEIETTVSGLSKKAGKWFEENGGLKTFTTGTQVPADTSGRTASIFNDLDSVRNICINGHWITLGSNIAIINVPYTLGVASEWLLMLLDNYIDSDELLENNGTFKGW